jgi:hypothetical protein
MTDQDKTPRSSKGKGLIARGAKYLGCRGNGEQWTEYYYCSPESPDAQGRFVGKNKQVAVQVRCRSRVTLTEDGMPKSEITEACEIVGCRFGDALLASLR